MHHAHWCNVIWTDTTQEPTGTQGTAAKKQKDITPTTTLRAVSNVLKAATTSNVLAETHVSLKDVRVGDGDPLVTAGDSKNSDQIREMQDSDGETAGSQHAAAVTRLLETQLL